MCFIMRHIFRPPIICPFDLDWVPSRFMRKFICRLRLNEVSRQ